MRLADVRAAALRALHRLGGTRFGVRAIGRIISPVQRRLYRATAGRVSLTGRVPVLLLTTTGRRTGRRRTVALFYVRDGERLVVCNVDPGLERPDPWTLNLRAEPHAWVQTGGERTAVVARDASDLEVERVWPQLLRIWPVYEAFRVRGGKRSVFVLEPVEARRAESRAQRGECAFDLATGILRPPEAVYALLADVQDVEPVPHRATVELVKEPLAPTMVGTVWHERMQLVRGWWLRVDSVVTAADEPRRLGMDFRSRWFSGHLTYDLERVGNSTVLHQRETLRPRAPLGPLAPVITRRLQPRLEERLDDIRRLLERQPAAEPDTTLAR